jgi:hypothetical protein
VHFIGNLLFFAVYYKICSITDAPNALSYQDMRTNYRKRKESSSAESAEIRKDLSLSENLEIPEQLTDSRETFTEDTSSNRSFSRWNMDILGSTIMATMISQADIDRMRSSELSEP